MILHVADFHLQLQILGNLSRLDHRAVFAGFGLFVLLQVSRSRLAVDTAHLNALLQVGLLHLEQHQAAGQGDHADVVAGLCLNGHHVALLQVKVVVIAVKALARVLELYLDKVGGRQVARHIGQVVIRVELPVAASAAFGT